MLPYTFQKSDKFDVYAKLTPAKEVGGDLFDYLVRDNCLYIAIGLVDDFDFEKETLQLSKGTRLLLYTDGVTEAEDVDKNQYGEDRLLEFIQNTSEEDSSEAVINKLFSSVKEFTGENVQNDDITVLTVKL